MTYQEIVSLGRQYMQETGHQHLSLFFYTGKGNMDQFTWIPGSANTPADYIHIGTIRPDTVDLSAFGKRVAVQS